MPGDCVRVLSKTPGALLGMICFPLPEVLIRTLISHRDLCGLKGSLDCRAPKSRSQLARQLPAQSVALGPAQRMLVCGSADAKGLSRVPKGGNTDSDTQRFQEGAGPPFWGVVDG